MFKRIALLCFLLSSFGYLYGQIEFEEGFIIDLNNERQTCLIKNFDWKNNPKEISYKYPGSNEIFKGDVTNISGFGVAEVEYKTATVQVDQSSNILGNLSYKRNPEFAEATIFIKVLVTGKANLFAYSDAGSTRYFYHVDDQPITQLVYKRYYNQFNKVATNNQFRQQLWTNLKCPEDIALKDLSAVRYNQRDLSKHFIDFNICEGGTSNYVGDKVIRETFNLKIRPGIKYGSAEINTDFGPSTLADLGSSFSPRIGLEAELILPFQKGKWSLLFEPAFQSFVNETNDNSAVQFRSLDLPLGIRHYILLDEGNQIFLNLRLLPRLSVQLGDSFVRTASFTEENPEDGNSLSFGMGWAQNKLSIELEVAPDRNLLYQYSGTKTGFTGISLIAGYKFYSVMNK